MRRLTFAAIAATLVLALSASVAGAENGIRFEPIGTTLTLANLEVREGFGTARCDVILDKAHHPNVQKSLNTLLGLTDVRIRTGACAQGDMGLLVAGRRVTGERGPYHLTYESFNGTLPEIESITLTLNNVSFWILEGDTECLTNGVVDISMTTTGGNPATGAAITAHDIPLAGDLFACFFATGDMNGSGNYSAGITMTLY